MNVERLRILSKALRDLDAAKKRLSMPEGKDPEKFKFDFSTFGTLLPTCETRACAFGLAALLPELRAQGLGYVIQQTGNGNEVLVVTLDDTPERFEEQSQLAARFFDIPNGIAYSLFITGDRWVRRPGLARPVSETDVANNIDYAIDHFPDYTFGDKREMAGYDL